MRTFFGILLMGFAGVLLGLSGLTIWTGPWYFGMGAVVLAYAAGGVVFGGGE